MGNKNSDGGFFKGLVREAVAYYRGYESEITEERMRFRVRKIGLGIQGYSNVAQNVGFRTGKVRTSFGYAPLGYTRGDSGKQRCFGIIPSPSDKLHFYASFCSNTPTAAVSYFNLLTNGLTAMDTHIPQNLASYGLLNQKAYIADGSSFNYYSGSAIQAPVTQIPAAPTVAASTTYLFTVEGAGGVGGNDRVKKTDSSGNYLTKWGSTGTGNSQFQSAQGICTDVSGAIWVLDAVNGVIKKFDGLGNYLLNFPLPAAFGTYSAGSNYHMGIAVDPVGNIWLVSQQVNSLFQLNGVSGTLINQFGASGSGNGQFNTPTGVCVDANGNIWVSDTANHRIQKFTNTGVWLANFTSSFTAVLGICADNASSIYAVDSGTNTIYQININSNALTNSFASHYASSFPTSIATDNTYLYVTDLGASGATEEITKYTIAGSFQSSWGSIGTGNNQFNNVTGVVAVNTNATTSPTGFLNGAYLYVATFSDANGDSTGAGAPLQAMLSYQQAQIAVSSTGFDTGTTTGWTTVNLYRTQGIFSPIPPISQPMINQSFYLVGSQALTGAGSYTFNDNISDLGSQGGITTMAPLTTNTPVTISAVNYVIEIENRIYAFGVTDNTDSKGNVGTTQIYHPCRVRWCELNNPGSWPPLNFNDFNEGGQNLPIIGAWAADRMIYAFKESFTFEMVPTGQSDPASSGFGSSGGVPYNYVQASHAYGFFHHSMADMGGTVIGKCKDGIATFNGSKFAVVSYGISSLMTRLINPTGDSGAFDNNTKKYYLAVCDSGLQGTYGAPMQNAAVNYLLQNAWRNTTIVFDTAENTFEIHPLTFIQVYRTVADRYGKPIILYGGVCSEIGVLTGENQFGGVSYPGLGTVQANNVVQDTTFGGGNNPVGFVGKSICIPYFWDTTTQTLNNLNFISTITAAVNNSGTLSLTLADTIPLIVGTNIPYLVDNATGLSDTGSTGGQLSGGVTNEFNAAGVEGCSWVYNDNTTYLGYPIFNQLKDSASGLNVSALNTINSSGPGATGLQYVFMPFRYFTAPAFNELVPWEPRRLYLSSPYGLDQENVVKSYRYLELIIKGNATLLIRIYINGNAGYKQRLVKVLATGSMNVLAQTPLTKYLLDLGGYTGTLARIEFGTIKGNDNWEIQSCAVWFRQQGSLRNNAT